MEDIPRTWCHSNTEKTAGRYSEPSNCKTSLSKVLYFYPKTNNLLTLISLRKLTRNFKDGDISLEKEKTNKKIESILKGNSVVCLPDNSLTCSCHELH